MNLPVYPLPDYLTKVKYRTKLEQLRAHSNFWVKLAALYNHPSGSVMKLSDRLPSAKTAVAPQALRADQLVSPSTAVAIERVVGRHLIRREMLRPDVFEPPE